MQMKYISCSSNGGPGMLRKIVALVVTVALGILALMFSAVLLAIILVVGAIAGVYLWWKTREVRRQMQDFSAQRGAAVQDEMFAGEVFEGEIIEGEAVRVHELRIEERR